MPLEIERKFLVANDSWRPRATTVTTLVQGYFQRRDDACIRIRIRDGASARLTIKNAHPGLLARAEFEYPIPLDQAQQLLDQFCGQRLVHKRRHLVPCHGHTWEIDEFLGRHAPLLIAEIELDTPDQPFDRPDWLGTEVTGDIRYANETLANF